MAARRPDAGNHMGRVSLVTDAVGGDGVQARRGGNDGVLHDGAGLGEVGGANGVAFPVIRACLSDEPRVNGKPLVDHREELEDFVVVGVRAGTCLDERSRRGLNGGGVALVFRLGPDATFKESDSGGGVCHGK